MSESQKREVIKRVQNGRLYSDGTIFIENVRASYPHVLEPYEGENDDGTKTSSYGIVGLMPKDTHKEAMQLCVQRINELLKENQIEKIAADKKFIRNGDDLAKPECEGMYVVSARESKKPDARDRDRRKLTDADKDLIYGGCYVNILIRPWFQNHKKYGKRVNAGFSAVQFVGDGEPFGTGRITSKDVDDTFDDLDNGSSGATSNGGDDDGL